MKSVRIDLSFRDPDDRAAVGQALNNLEEVVLGLEAFGIEPMVLHAVRTFDRILYYKKQLRPSMPWIIHGFRGNATTASALLSKGISLSFGEKWTKEALLHIPDSQLLIETDEAHANIDRIIENIAAARNTTPENIKKTASTNACRILFGH